SYIESYDIQAAGAAVVLDPVPDVVTDGNTLSVRPVAERTRLLEVRRALQNRGIDTSRVAPVRPLQGQVTAVSSEIGLVVISIGRDDGVIEGGELSVFRGDQFVAKITIDRIDSRWSAGRITLKGQAGDPRVGDRVSNTTIEEPPELHPLRDIVANTGWGPRLLANLIRTHIAPGTWTGEHTIDVTPHDHLLVHHTAETQAAVRAFLERLRQNPQLVFDLREFQRLRAMGGTR
ncbi:MAG: hypothetical protein HYY16_01725, partial [Planctomycetes bacterium]|nr:hypothetical protein [Planctomycetota bacterium]